MAAGLTTVQDILDALAEYVPTAVPAIKAAHATDITQIKANPTLIFSWFSGEDTEITNSGTQMWIVAAKATLYADPIKGNLLTPSIKSYGNLIHPLVDAINVHPHRYPYGSKMTQLEGVDRINVVRVRPAEFGLEYAGHRYFGAELFLDIKMHRKIEY